MIEGYRIVRLDEENKAYSHHGLLVYVRDNIVIEDVQKYPGATFEAVELVLKKDSLLPCIITVYKSPSASIQYLNKK